MTPFEIIVAPFTLYLAPVGTAFPLIDAAPAMAWTKVGTNGALDYDEAGVTVTHKQTLNAIRTLGSTGPRKAVRTDEDFMIGLTLLDMTLEQYAVALNSNAVTTTAAGVGTAGFKKVGLSRGLNVATMAVLVRGVSAYDESMNAQFEIPRAYQSASPAPVARKNQPMGLQLEFTALEDPAATNALERFGRMVMQHMVGL